MPNSPSRFGRFFRAAAAILIAGGLAAGAPSNAGGREADPRAPRRASPSADSSPFLGQWELDLARMPENYGTPPKRVTFTFEDLGSGQWLTEVEITAQDGSVRHMVVRYRRDGRAVHGEGDTAEGDSAAFNSPAPNVLVMSMAKDQRLVGVRTYAISADGREMTESAAGVDASGAPFVRGFHFRRIG